MQNNAMHHQDGGLGSSWCLYPPAWSEPSIDPPMLNLFHLGFNNKTWLDGIPVLKQTLGIVIMTLINDLFEYSHLLVFYTEKGGCGLEGRVHPGALNVWPCKLPC